MYDDSANELWHVQVSAGDVRTVALEGLDALYRYDSIDENVYVWKKGMTEWVQLRTLLGIESTEPEEPFHVLLGSGNARELSLEQLDEFYRHEIIDENTMVWQKGMTEWQPLGKVAGIDEAVPAEPPTLPQRQIATQPLVARALSAPPVAFTVEPPDADDPSHPLRWPVRWALVAGAVLAIFRNDFAYAIASQTALASRYTKAESAIFGGPAFGTTRSVERLVTECGGQLEPVRLPIAVAQFVHAQQAIAAQAKAQSTSGLASNGATAKPDSAAHSPLASTVVSSSVVGNVSAPVASGAKLAVVATSAPSAPSAKDKPASPLTQNVAAALGGLPVNKGTPQPKSDARPAPRRKVTRKAAVRSNGSYFDPLNPTL